MNSLIQVIESIVSFQDTQMEDFYGAALAGF